MAYFNGKQINVALLQGLSAYEVAVKNGFEGTEQEWVDSLKGDLGNIETALDEIIKIQNIILGVSE